MPLEPRVLATAPINTQPRTPPSRNESSPVFPVVRHARCTTRALRAVRSRQAHAVTRRDRRRGPLALRGHRQPQRLLRGHQHQFPHRHQHALEQGADRCPGAHPHDDGRARRRGCVPTALRLRWPRRHALRRWQRGPARHAGGRLRPAWRLQRPRLLHRRAAARRFPPLFHRRFQRFRCRERGGRQRLQQPALRFRRSRRYCRDQRQARPRQPALRHPEHQVRLGGFTYLHRRLQRRHASTRLPPQCPRKRRPLLPSDSRARSKRRAGRAHLPSLPLDQYFFRIPPLRARRDYLERRDPPHAGRLRSQQRPHHGQPVARLHHRPRWLRAAEQPDHVEQPGLALRRRAAPALDQQGQGRHR